VTPAKNASVIVEAKTSEEAEQIFLHDMDRDAIEWKEGDWLGDTEIVEILLAAEDTPLTGQVQVDPSIPERILGIANGILDMLENNDAGKGRVFFDPEQVLKLRHLADRLGQITSALRPLSRISTPLRSSEAGSTRRSIPLRWSNQ
jgi:hypothetical protein